MTARPKTILRAVMLAILVTLLIATLVLAAPNAFSISWWTVDGGGGTSQGGDYAVSGTIGQPDTSPLMSGGDYEVVGGFWGGALENLESYKYLYLPVTVK
ncbi:hypothetical protein ACFLXI_05515 [Chloroflexota bacterium]